MARARVALADRLRDASWPLAYGFDIFICIGQIIASEVANHYGERIFGVAAGTNNGNSGGGGNQEDNQINLAERDHALARTGVVSSIGIAIGSVNLVLTVGSFAAYKYLDYRRSHKDTSKDYDQRFVVFIVVTFLNLILFGGSITLAVFYFLTGQIVRQYTTVESSATPGYLRAAGIMSALSAATLIAIMIADRRKLIAQRRVVEKDEEERVVHDDELEERVYER